MKKFGLMILALLFSFTLFSCNEDTNTDSVKEVIDDNNTKDNTEENKSNGGLNNSSNNENLNNNSNNNESVNNESNNTELGNSNNDKPKYTITWVDYNDNVLETDLNVEEGATPSFDSDEPARASDNVYSYTFKGWDSELATVDGDKTYKATYDSTYIDYQIKFIDENSNELSKNLYRYGDKFSVPAYTPTKEETKQFTFTFDGWYSLVDDTKYDENTVVTKNDTYYPKFNEVVKAYNITWLNSDGSTIDVTKANYGTIPTHAAPVKASDLSNNYVFNGWNPTVTEVIGDATYKAVFESEPIKYTVKFLSEDGNTVYKETEMGYGQKISAPTTTPTKEETKQYKYEFEGYYLDNGNYYTSESTVYGNLTYYAKFKEITKKYTLRFFNGDTLIGDPVEYEYGTKASEIEAPTPTKAATNYYTYKFTGWSPELKDVTEHTSYYAQFTPVARLYYVTFVDYNGK